MLDKPLILTTKPGYYLTDIGLVPKYYYVPEFAIRDERKDPGSQEKMPASKEYVSLWDQSLYIIVKLLGKFIHIALILILPSLLVTKSKCTT